MAVPELVYRHCAWFDLAKWHYEAETWSIS